MIVGIGASAGGLQALKDLFSEIPADSGLAFVVVVHLSPEHPSLLADVLQPFCAIPVHQVTENTQVEPDRVYVIPPASNLSTIDSHLRLSDMAPARGARTPIDHFFETLADTHRERCVGVILSGMGADGTAGIKKIKEQGGLTLVQDPHEAEFDAMPHNAIATRLIDLILPAREMPRHILRFARTRPRIEVSADESISEPDRQILQQIFAQLRARTGQDFSKYKRSTVLRRIRRRMQLHQKELLGDYLEFLRLTPGEVRLLAEEFLITVTRFFRDAGAFEHLETEAIPRLFEGRTSVDRIRVWSVGCATGEEAYSIAMLLLEQAARVPDPPELEIFASDLREHSLERAREGRYPDTIEADVSPQRLQRFFVNEGGGYRVRKEVREIVVFASHNLLRDPPFSRLQLIVCRNLLIYLQRQAQNDVIDLFHYALEPGGLLLLGPSETIESSALFQQEHKHQCLYRRRNIPAPEPRLPVFPRIPRRDIPGTDAHLRRERPVSYGTLHEKMVERYSLPSILVDQDFRVVHSSETAGRYLQVPGGEISANVFKLIRDELRVELSVALQTASEDGRSVRSAPIRMQIDGQEQLVMLHVRRSDMPQMDGLYLVIFDEMDQAEWNISPADPARNSSELDLTKEHLRAVISQYEIFEEEMRAANEELQSANEELRSTMVELETSKEELQSMNEELQTVNQENRHRLDELSSLTSDLNNLMAATEIATLFLDRELRIMRVTPRVGELFNVRPSDQGRPLTDLTHRLGYDQLQADAARVLERLMPIEREIQSEDGDWYLTRILPYRSPSDLIQGIVITLVDITHHKKVELALRNSEEAFRALVSASAQIVWTTDAHGQLIEDSPSWRMFTGQRFEQLRGSGWLDTVHSDDRDGVRAGWVSAVETESPFTAEFRIRHVNGSWRWTHVRAVPLHDENGRLRGYVGMNTDITERRNSEEALRQADRRKDEFMAALGHELRNLLAPMRTGMDLFERLLPDDPKLQQIRRLNDRQIVHLTRLVDDLLDVSRVKSGRMELQMQRIDLRDTVRTAVTRMETVMNERRHKFSLEQYVEPLLIDGDETRLVQIVTNLLSNAAKYTPEGGHIRIGTERVEQDAVITVTDSGMGISTDTLSNIFQVFWQGPSGPSRPDSGLGLGLTLVQQLVVLHGGSVEANSAGPGQGSIFTVRLPLAAAQSQESLPRAVRDMNRA
ncbi:MAG TPA: chemotaxis protein CheB [Gammaproteobacteria bacterium]